MTVCIAARAGADVFGASDRMLTSGDVQFEPSAGTKIYFLTNAICMMTAGDAALQAEITTGVNQEIAAKIASEPNKWVSVSDAAEIYIAQYNVIKNKRAEDAILRPLHLDGPSFVASQKMLTNQLVNDLSKELLNFPMPQIAAIFAGVDSAGTHIYIVQEGETNSLEANCVDNVGFAAIGIGRRHASSQFMFARHAWNSPIADTLLLTYYAKKKSEVAPGVGKGTDMVIVSGLGGLTQLKPEVLDKLEQEYNELVAAENAAFSKARGMMARYVEELAKQAAAASAVAPGEQAAPKADGSTTTTNGS